MNRQKKLQTAISFALFRMQMHTHPDSPHAGIPLKHTLSWADFLHDSELYNAWKHTPHENKSVSYKMHFANWWAWVHHCVCQLLLDRLKYCRNWWCINCKYLQKNYLHHQRKSSQSVQSMIIFCLLFFLSFIFAGFFFTLPFQSLFHGHCAYLCSGTNTALFFNILTLISFFPYNFTFSGQYSNHFCGVALFSYNHHFIMRQQLLSFLMIT